MYRFFSPNESELKQVIGETLHGKDAVVAANTIQTGWTNITMDVQGEASDYIFRFPRNLFFARMMVKDCLCCDFIRQNVSTPVPQMQLRFHQERPFSMHQKIKGVSLTSHMDHLSDSEQTVIASDLARFLTELHALSTTLIPSKIKETLNEFLIGLASVHRGHYDTNRHAAWEAVEKACPTPVIVHGDLNPGNVLIDQTGHVSGVIDFSFVAVSDPHADLGRFVGRTTPALGERLVTAYEAKTGQPCDRDKIKAMAELFRYVEYKYVRYMQSDHPEIVIPATVLNLADADAKQFERTHI